MSEAAEEQSAHQQQAREKPRLPGMLGRLQAAWYMLRDPDAPLLGRLGVVVIAIGGLMVMIGYGIWPLDLLPDVFPPLTYIDDLLVVPAVLWVMSLFMPRRAAAHLLQKFRKRRGAQASSAS